MLRIALRSVPRRRDCSNSARAAKPFFHAYVRAPEGEKLSRDEWQTFADRLERQLGFDDQPRAVAFHHDQLSCPYDSAATR